MKINAHKHTHIEYLATNTRTGKSHSEVVRAGVIPMRDGYKFTAIGGYTVRKNTRNKWDEVMEWER